MFKYLFVIFEKDFFNACFQKKIKKLGESFKDATKHLIDLNYKF